jgi:hypothetical protein
MTANQQKQYTAHPMPITVLVGVILLVFLQFARIRGWAGANGASASPLKQPCEHGAPLRHRRAERTFGPC